MVATRLAGHSYIIKRPRLTKLLDESQARIILLCAPAGYGKTTLAREWIATRSEPVAWYQGGPEMLDVAAVAQSLADIAEALGASTRLTERVRALASRTSKPEPLGRAVAEALSSVRDAVLVVDDYHRSCGTESDRLFETVIANTDGRAIFTSRVRPNWMSARMCVYGEIFVVEQPDLAFTDEEARTVLKDGGVQEIDQLARQAEGWPAVIGLAARRDTRRARDSVGLLPTELYTYIADDLFRSVSTELRESLFVLCLLGATDAGMARALLGGRAQLDLSNAASLGLLTQRGNGVELHPLLQAFLLKRLHEEASTRTNDLVERVLTQLASAHRWDDCLWILSEFPNARLAEATLAEALPELLEAGRVSTIKRWLELLAPNRENAIILIAKSEIALREGANTEAQVLAERAADTTCERTIRARAYLLAARAAHLRGDGAGTRRNARLAEELTTSHADAVLACWLGFLTALEFQEPDVRQMLERLQQTPGSSAERSLRLIHATAFVATEIDGNLRLAQSDMELGYRLLDHVADPLARTAFRNFSAARDVTRGAYESALDLVDQQIDDARANGLDFVEDYALSTRIGALIGLRRLGAAQRALRELEKRGTTSSFVLAQAKLRAARLRVASGDLRRAELELREQPPGELPHFFHGEWLSSRALYSAAMGETSFARELAEEALARSSFADTRVIGTLALTVADLRDEREGATNRAIENLTALIKQGQVDSVALACRAFPKITESVSNDRRLSQELTSVLSTSRDFDIARAAGLDLPRELRRQDGLTPRERDVYALLAQGQTNRGIARTLFLSESTVKVHVRHIFEKLNVHSRAEAAALHITDDPKRQL